MQRVQGEPAHLQLHRTYCQSHLWTRYVHRAPWGTPARHQPTPSIVTRAKLTLEHLGIRTHNASGELRAVLLINKSSGK